MAKQNLHKGEVNLTLFSEQLRALMDAQGIGRAHLLGFSIGGMINRRFALDYPDRVASLLIWNSPMIAALRRKQRWRRAP